MWQLARFERQLTSYQWLANFSDAGPCLNQRWLIRHWKITNKLKCNFDYDQIFSRKCIRKRRCEPSVGLLSWCPIFQSSHCNTFGNRPPVNSIYGCPVFDTLRPRQNGRLFADDTFKGIFLNENIRISIKISLKCVPKGLINNIPALVLIMAWRRPGDKPLSEPMMVRSLTHICVTRPQWVKWIAETWLLCTMIINQAMTTRWLFMIICFGLGNGVMLNRCGNWNEIF